MAKADRLERLDSRREALEAEYCAALVAALQVTAAGSWGLFDHKPDRATQAKIAPVVDELTDMGASIDGLRAQLSMAPFDLHRQFLASRGPVASSKVGEPKQAQAWLDKLGIPAAGPAL
ncbi:hypothetical protein [Sphingomonas sp. 28-63-12]|uniref:hypothetical protein n=1 Tax=Sphingomonas sp. 28-63-12 TaxID=1970434 RepID=UPI000BCB1C37|nr:MAG: hypothetical protein B7Y47_11515 [Sphingomonas sp. 28-63-12]